MGSSDPMPDQLSDSSSVSDPLDTRDDDGWDDVEPDVESVTVISLFDEKSFPDAQSMLAYCRDHHGFDMWKIRRDWDLDFLGLVRLVNYVRSEVQAGNRTPQLSKGVFQDDKYLKPVLQDDALLFSLDDVFEGTADADADADGDGTADAKARPVSEVEQLRDQLDRLQSQFSAYREQVQTALLDRLESAEAPRSSPAGSATQLESDPHGHEDGYFHSYSYNAIHESMIKDRIRTDAYRDFIYDHKHLFHDKVVLDVGCGTGILSMFCAKAGAKLVVAVDNSAIIDKARENVFHNGLQDTVKCVRGKIEEVTLPVDQVDIIVSEWMGYCLLYESMLDSVLYARDRYLRPTGLMVPSHATLRIAPLAESDLKSSHIDFWRDVYGFDMTAMLERAHEEVVVQVVDEKELAASSVDFLALDLHQTRAADLNFTRPFAVTCARPIDCLEGFVVWFDIIFATSRTEAAIPTGMTAAAAKERGLVAFSTGPLSAATHWQQGIFLIKDPTQSFAAGDAIHGDVTYLKKEGKERSLDIDISWGHPGQAKQPARRQRWILD